LATIEASATTICAGVQVTLTATVDGGGEPYSYSWSPGAGNTASIQVSPMTTTEYTLTVTDNCGTQVITSQTITVSPVPNASAGHDAPVCTGATLQLNGSTDIGTTYLWTGPNGFTSTELSPTITNVGLNASGIYNLVASVGSCSSVAATTTVSVGPAAGQVIVTPASATICPGGSVELVASGAGTETFGTAQLSGTAVTSTQFNTKSPYYRNFENRRTQYLVRATELNAQNFNTLLQSIAFTVTAAPSVNPNNMNGYTIRLANTTNTDATAQYTGAMTTVFGPVNYSPVVGLNTHTFSTPFNWDGVSNLLIEICFENDPNNTCTNVSNSCWGNDPTVTMVSASYIGTWVKYADNVAQCGFVGAPSTTSAERPLMTFTFGEDLPATYTWSPAAGLSATSGTTVTATPVESTTYTVTGSLANGCSSTTTVTVTLNDLDSDGDGILDCDDDCPALAGEIGGTCDPGPGFQNGVIQADCTCLGTPIPDYLDVISRVFLDGAYVSATGLMRDDLRAGGHLPLAHPYGAAPWNHVGSELVDASVLAVTGNDAVVDWVLLELRDPNNTASVLGRRAALVQRDGDIVDLDGSSPVRFPGMDNGQYHLAVRHRNHLSAMTGSSYALSDIPTVIDLTVAATSTFGTNARKTSGAVMLLWAGNANSNLAINYSGGSNDRTSILNLLGASTYLNPVLGYHAQDVNMNGAVTYSGGTNDRTLILNNLGASTYLTPLVEQLP
jgi:hypothetical protein